MATGKKTGGRVKGTPNRATVQKALIAEQVVARAEMTGRKLAKEVLDEFMHLFAGMAASTQPLPPGMPVPPGRVPDEAKFEKYARLAIQCAKDLAPYQSPTFRAIQVIAGPTDPAAGAKVIDNDNVVPPFHRLHARFRGNVAAQTFMEKVHMLVTHVNHVEIPRFTDDALAAEALNRDLRIQLMMNKIGDDAFKRKLYMREKRRHYRDDVRQVLAMVSAVIGDALRTAFADASPTALETATKTLVELRGYANESLGVISKRYKFVVPLITEAWKINSAKG